MSLESVSANGDATARAPWGLAIVRAGSPIQAASTWGPSGAAGSPPFKEVQQRDVRA
ncbi:MAG TPA: hypothetical protein VFH94_18335 [Streptomyces sp.]|nr:hypothetical protein [Streptomyces sp.]